MQKRKTSTEASRVEQSKKKMNTFEKSFLYIFKIFFRDDIMDPYFSPPRMVHHDTYSTYTLSEPALAAVVSISFVES